MKCPYCGAPDTKVVDSRPSEENNAVRRRRQCIECGKRFTTYEKYESVPFMVVKKDSTREVYDRSKIESGILRSCHKRPVSKAQVKKLVDDIEAKIFSKYDREVRSDVIGQLVMEGLKTLDEVAYVRFASVYREFKDVKTFVDEVSRLRK